MTNDMDAPAPIPGFRSAFATIDGVRLHYRVGGDASGRPVVHPENPYGEKP